MTDLERRALLGDREAQEECTRQGIVLPCQCGNEFPTITETNLRGIEIRCPSCNTTFTRDYYSTGRGELGRVRTLEAWNTRQGPPIVRCGECKHWHKEHCARGPSPCCTLQTPADYYCPYGEPKETDHENMQKL